ncbi:MAG: putative lipid II flippase FtsW [Deltaproteobacteria bacterium]|nr:putative lipid II flippase FtsW [Candidatus Anaeroferrophillacea bacterium]
MKRTELSLLLMVAGLLFLGLVMVYSASAPLAREGHGSSYHFLFRQLVFAGLGAVALAGFRRLDYRWWGRSSMVLTLGTTVLLLLVFVPGIGIRAGGACRWLKTPLCNVQPAELAKLATVVYLGNYLARHDDRLHEFRRGLLPPLIIIAGFILLLLLEPDFGTSMIIVGLSFTMCWLGGARWFHLGALGLTILPLAAVLVRTSPYRWQRITTFLDPWRDATGSGFQLVQSLIAIGVGGLGGLGLGNGKQKLFFLPEPHTDFIVSVVGEELGFIGICVLVAGAVGLLLTGMRIALASDDRFGMLLAAGITVMLVMQMMVNMGVCMGVLPTKGLTYPFLSYGGSSLMVSMTAIGVLMNISRQAVPAPNGRRRSG